MKATLDVPYVDTSAAALALSLNAGGRRPLASLPCAVGGARLVLSVLGGSHQVVARVGAAEIVEVVACDPAKPRPGHLPSAASTTVGGMRHDFRAEIHRLDANALRDAVDRLVADLADRDDAIVALFPGDAHAVTALALQHDAGAVAAWTTWHAYPSAGEIVRTWTSVTAVSEA